MQKTIGQRTGASSSRPWDINLFASCYCLMLCVSLMCMSSCAGDALIDDFRSIPDRAWAYGFKPAFEVPVDDISKPYNIKLNLRVTLEYKYANIFVLVRQKDPNGKTTTDRVELRLAANDGRWLGRGGGGLYSYQSSYKKNYYFADTGRYSIEIEQNMRDNPLLNVSDVGICVEPSKGR